MPCEPVPKSRRSCPPVRWDSIHLPANLHALLAASKERTLSADVSIFAGFGSFHSENVEDLMAMDEATYRPPEHFPAFAKRILSKSEIARVQVAPPDDAAYLTLPGGNPSRKRSRCEVMRCGDAVSLVEVLKSRTETAPEDKAHSGAGHDDTDDVTNKDSALDSDERRFSALSFVGAWSACAKYEIREMANQAVGPCELGNAFRLEYFNITPAMVFINHGAFGGTLVGAMLIKWLYEEHMEAEVVQFVDRELLPLIVYSIRALSRFLHADPRQVVLLQNATFGLNCAMRMIVKDDVVACFDTEYLAVYKMLWFRCKEVGASLHEVCLNRFLHDPEVMGDNTALTAEICRQLPANCTTVVLDYVTSTSALCFPVFTHIIPALRQRGVRKIIVDGAHAPLQVDLDFKALPPESQPSVFVGNLHKWFSSPKAAGFFWVRSDEAEKMHSVVLSHGAGEGLLSEFIWDGTRDYGTYLSIPAIVDFWEKQGLDRVRDYCSHLLSSAADMLTIAFHSRRVARHAPFMSLVELPEKLQDSLITAKYIQDSLHDIARVEVPVKRIEGRYYLRISAFVYNTPDEYIYLREAVLSVADKWVQSPQRKHLHAQRLSSHATATAASDQLAAVP
ncbi:conserved hypothetical protein [Leishmania mexicana MHOM/GT/2001/U1103]|uniref:Aminotransferase class V domain-containing protein n=1 Tax=Leishmania mexicana (strain MHOM/GT/2001/U1103) TaxID=929439 RepID=E9AZI1_LEIMU|nr:conserved hypothetical protein [Leishmania mexicana MHOM/GT/2001/U1103]CBZ28381.1 conserved hypothetical protein [Leishmania mexicana MHOM/GT/2001/U1103]